jgi:hypothetical protein
VLLLLSTSPIFLIISLILQSFQPGLTGLQPAFTWPQTMFMDHIRTILKSMNKTSFYLICVFKIIMCFCIPQNLAWFKVSPFILLDSTLSIFLTIRSMLYYSGQSLIFLIRFLTSSHNNWIKLGYYYFNKFIFFVSE